MSTAAYYSILYVGICLFLMLLLGAYFKATGKLTDPQLQIWMRYVAKAAPLILGSLPNFPPALVPLVVQAIGAAELSFGDGAGVQKKDAVMSVIRQSDFTDQPGYPDMRAVSKGLDEVVKLANHATEVHTNLEKGLNGDGSVKV